MFFEGFCVQAQKGLNHAIDGSTKQNFRRHFGWGRKAIFQEVLVPHADLR